MEGGVDFMQLYQSLPFSETLTIINDIQYIADELHKKTKAQ